MCAIRPTSRPALGAVLIGWLSLAAAPVPAQQDRVRGHGELEGLLRERAGVEISLPDLGYSWREADISGTLAEGSVRVAHTKMIYYFVHWGPIESGVITEEYVRRRIPEIWPGEGLRVTTTRAATVAGHPAIYAEATPRRGFYRAQFLVWNCPESGRQFIADMNYNVSYLTPRSELQAQIDATTHTLSCHAGAPTSSVPGHVVRYESPRFNLAFSHPLRWYVFESPYRVPHPAYRGIRDERIGSVLAWLKDREVEIGFFWRPGDRSDPGDTTEMAETTRRYRAAVDLVSRMEGVRSFAPEASETVTIGSRQVVKVLGTARRVRSDSAPPGLVAESRAAVFAVGAIPSGRGLFVVVRIDNYSLNGLSLPADRDIFDRWVTEIVSGLR